MEKTKMINKEKEWQPIPISSLFNELANGKAKGRNHLVEVEQNGIAYIGATNRNAGVMCFIEENSTSEKLLQKGNCIGFIRNGDGAAGYAIYRESAFVSTSDVIFGYGDWVNKETGLFFVVSQDKIKPKYSHGHKRSPERLAHDLVMLPIEESGNPDFQYMKDYISDLKDKLLERYKTYLTNQLAELGPPVELVALNKKNWIKYTAFGAGGLFTIAATKSSIDGIKIIDDGEYKIPYITRSSLNNGIAKFVSSKNMQRGYDKGGCIIIGLDTQTAFWQPHDFVTGQNIQVISGRSLNKYVALFLIPLLKKQMDAKFNWGGNGATLSRMKRLEIMLPANDIDNPDYAYMEQYAKNIIIKKYKQYLNFINHK